MVPTAEQLKQFLVGVVLPVIVSALTTWIFATTHVLDLFHISETEVAGELTLLGVWAVSMGVSVLHSHHILAGKYTPMAKARAGK